MESSDCNEVFEIDTKGVCLLCLKDGGLTFNSETFEGNFTNASSFKMFLRYLKINTYKTCNFSSSFLQSMDALEDVNLAVSLCNDCRNTINVISKLYQDMELIRLQLDSYLQSLHDAMQLGKSSGVRVDEYWRRMRSRNMYEMFNASVAENLRNETIKKCSQTVEAMIPRVSLLQREQNSLVSFFGFPSSSTHLRKLPGPKSKTQVKRSSSMLKALLNQNAWNSNASKCINISNTASAGLLDNTNDLEYSEEFVVKVEPIIADHDMSNFHNENEDENDNIDNEFKQNASAIANFDGQLIGHFLGGEVENNTPNDKIKSEGGNGDFFCDICKKSFSSSFSLGGHMHIHKNRPKKPGSKKATAKASEGVAKKINKCAFKKKKKFKCSVCKKIMTTRGNLQAHLKRYHGDAKNGGNVFDCEVCGKQFFQHQIHRTHMVSLHSMHVFSKYLPAGTTENQLDAAIQGVTAQHRVIKDPSKKKNKLYGCQYCIQVLPHPSHLRLHILKNHFDKVVVMLQSLFNENIEIETETGEVNEENDADDGEDTGNGDLRMLLEEGDEVDEGEINPQPILLSEAYSLAEGDEDGENDREDQPEQNGIQNDSLCNGDSDPLLDI